MQLAGLPLEMILEILQKLKPTDLLNSGFSSARLARLVAHIVPKVRTLTIGVSDGNLNAKLENDSAEVQVSTKERDEEVLKILMPHLAAAVESLHLENNQLKENVSDEQLAKILQLTKDAPLKELALSEMDLEKIHTWTLALLANFDKLEKVEIEECKLGGETEAKLLRCLQSSFQTLTQIDLKGTPEVTDHFARRVSRSCPNLSYFRISDCPRVTTLSALPLIESTAFRVTDKLDLHMDNTEFDADQLRSFMHSPLFGSCSEEWRLEPVTVPLGYDKPAVLALHSSRKIVLIFV